MPKLAVAAFPAPVHGGAAGWPHKASALPPLRLPLPHTLTRTLTLNPTHTRTLTLTLTLILSLTPQGGGPGAPAHAACGAASPAAHRRPPRLRHWREGGGATAAWPA